ncbi:MAG: butyrate kinase [Synergistetes bacterium]|nr:butyrate kinase [Synergistota bacterium]MCX8127452.1 butyrate kinase [Synergistota bacterium]MDW8192771.1 butyrate kinase [Synergistota bacterium]
MLILVINPGSTSTKVAIFDRDKELFSETLRHPKDELSKYARIIDQYQFRKNIILNFLKSKELSLAELSAVVGRGGLLKPIPGGTFLVNEAILDDLKNARYGEHASNLGAILAYEIAKEANCPAYIVDPVVVDELSDIARISGLKEITRRSIFHALNQKAVARRVACDLGKDYNSVNLVVAHLGGGISVGAHRKGKVVDVNNALNGDGPFTPERCPSIPTTKVLDLFEKGVDLDFLMKRIVGNGGLVAYFGTNSALDVEKMIDAGDQFAELVLKAMTYQVSKWIGKMASVLGKDIDAIVLTGGMAHSERITSWIKERVSFIAPVLVYPGEDEMIALALGALRVLKGEEAAKIYK